MKLTRRDFIKSTAASVAATAAGIPLAEGANIITERDAASVTWNKAPCRFCGTGCGVTVAVKNNRVIATHGDALAGGTNLSAPRPFLQSLRSGDAAVGGGGSRHGRASRCLGVGLFCALLRRPGLSRARQLHRQFQQAARALRYRRAQGLDGAQLLLQYRYRCEQRALLR